MLKKGDTKEKATKMGKGAYKEVKVKMRKDWKDKVKKLWDAKIAVFLIVIATAGCIGIVHSGSHEYLIIPIVGMVSFIIPLLLSFSSKYNLGTKLSKGEVRKSIVISLTVIYIVLLSLSFYQITYEVPTTNVTPNNSIKSTNITTFNVTAQTVPIQAIGNFTQNFLYVYIVIIGFYFGSRLCERIKMFKEFKDLTPLDIAKLRYAMGEIDSETFNEMKKDLI